MSGHDIAGICAHPDDAELVMGGTIAREAARGRRCVLVDLTRGESGSRGTPETRAAEAAEAARILGVVHRESLSLPDARLAHVPEHKDPIVEALRRLRPEIVILPYWDQRHPDHSTASRIGYDACFLAGLKNYRPELGAAFRPRKVVYALSMTEATEAPPSFGVDITALWEQKMRAVRADATQFLPGRGEAVTLPFERFQLAVEANARRHGERIGVQYGEGFLMREAFEIDDLLAIKGRSI
jgi:bacillithiol biosynthesis deacetylase BshB1